VLNAVVVDLAVILLVPKVVVKVLVVVRLVAVANAVVVAFVVTLLVPKVVLNAVVYVDTVLLLVL
tara:strand:+ start:3348 stop:3542 length:195 start_codon:yes stop_codon:yes gene_type:complete